MNNKISQFLYDTRPTSPDSEVEVGSNFAEKIGQFYPSSVISLSRQY